MELGIHFVAPILVIAAFYRIRRGMEDISSWPTLMFAIGFSSNAIAVPLAILGYEPYAWMLDLPATTTYGLVVIASMISFWAGHLTVRKGVVSWKWLSKVPPMEGTDSGFSRALYIFSMAGGAGAMMLSAAGYYGYYSAESVGYEPPAWLDIARLLITLQGGVLLFILWDEFRARGKPSLMAWILCAVWVFSGFASGFKTQVIMAGLFLVIAGWLTRRLQWRHMAVLGALLFVSYAVIEPLRDLRQYVQHDNAVRGLEQLATSDGSARMSAAEMFEQLVRRADYSGTGIVALAADENGQLNYYKARLDETYRLIPLLAFVPRAIWPDKPIADLGRDLSIELEDISTNSVTPSQPVGSYLWGGYLGVVLNNFIFGVAVTLCGALILRYGREPLKYFPILLCACILSLADTVMAYYYILALRYGLATFCFYIFFMNLGRGSGRAASPWLPHRR